MALQGDFIQRQDPVSVDRLTAAIQRSLQSEFRNVVVEGEVTSCRGATAGHLYFTLRGQSATLQCNVWRSTVDRMRRVPRDGDHVICHGGIEVYPPQGGYRLIVSAVRFGGDGELLQALDTLKRTLHAEGLFAQERKRPLPFLPRRIGLITAQTGAAVADIVRSVHVRYPAAILLAAAPVQGQGAHRVMIQALRALEQIEDVDVIVLGRGGGSLEDLWEFNQEALVRAIAACRKPVVSAVGHEVDWMLTDFVADARAATPTAVGELVVPEARALAELLVSQQRKARLAVRTCVERSRLRLRGLAGRLQDPRRLLSTPRMRTADLEDRLSRCADATLRRKREALRDLEARLLAAHPSARIADRRARLDALVQRLERAPRLADRRARLVTLVQRLHRASGVTAGRGARLASLVSRFERVASVAGARRPHLAALAERLQRAFSAALARHRGRLDRDHRTLLALSPLAVLGRGYAIVQHAGSGDVVRSAAAAGAGELLSLRFHDGHVAARVTQDQRDEPGEGGTP